MSVASEFSQEWFGAYLADRVGGPVEVTQFEKFTRGTSRQTWFASWRGPDGRSTEAEHREILRQVLATEIEPSFDALAAELRKLTRRRKQTPSEALLREGRDER